MKNCLVCFCIFIIGRSIYPALYIYYGLQGIDVALDYQSVLIWLVVFLEYRILWTYYFSWFSITCWLVPAQQNLKIVYKYSNVVWVKFLCFSAVISGRGVGIGFFATGVIASLGFVLLGLIWLYTTLEGLCCHNI